MYRKRIGNVIFFPGVTQLVPAQASYVPFVLSADIPEYARKSIEGMVNSFLEAAAAKYRDQPATERRTR